MPHSPKPARKPAVKTAEVNETSEVQEVRILVVRTSPQVTRGGRYTLPDGIQIGEQPVEVEFSPHIQRLLERGEIMIIRGE
jgi:hypothetical protein